MGSSKGPGFRGQGVDVNVKPFRKSTSAAAGGRLLALVIAADSRIAANDASGRGGYPVQEFRLAAFDPLAGLGKKPGEMPRQFPEPQASHHLVQPH